LYFVEFYLSLSPTEQLQLCLGKRFYALKSYNGTNRSKTENVSSLSPQD
jgi:hypothetical protein